LQPEEDEEEAGPHEDRDELEAPGGAAATSGEGRRIQDGEITDHG